MLGKEKTRLCLAASNEEQTMYDEEFLISKWGKGGGGGGLDADTILYAWQSSGVAWVKVLLQVVLLYEQADRNVEQSQPCHCLWFQQKLEADLPMTLWACHKTDPL